MASYVDITNTLNFAVALKPSSAFPLDARSMFGSYTAAAAAAASAAEPGSSDSIYYIGQTLTVYENDIVGFYQIMPNKTLALVGAKTMPDDKTIELNDEKLSLKSFGTKYYKHHNADTIVTGDGYTYPDNMPEAATGAFVQIGDVWYQKNADGWATTETAPVTNPYYELVNGWKAGLEPKVVQNGESFELAWYEPSTMTVEGVNSAVSALMTDVADIRSTVTANKAALETAINTEVTRATGVEDALNTRVTAAEGAITTLNGSAEVEGSVANQISTAINQIINNPDETMNSINELVTWCNEHADDALTLSNNVTANATAIAALETLVGDLPEGTSATSVIAFIVEEVARAKEAEEALAGRVTALETATADLGTAASKDVEFFATAEQGTKADSAVQSVAKSTSNGKISVDGVDVEVYSLPNASIAAVGGVKPDGVSVSTNDEGVLSVVGIEASKVTGLDTKIATAKEEAVDGAKSYTDTNAVAKSDIVTKDTLATSIDDASDTKVISEKVLIDALTWKTGE